MLDERQGNDILLLDVHQVTILADYFVLCTATSERQLKALAYTQEQGRITNREYRSLCPDVSTETLRLDLVDLVKRGILLKVGAKRGTFYILKESPT